MTDVYQVSYLGAYMNASRLTPGWRNNIQKTGAAYALLLCGSPMAAALVESKEWTVDVRQSRYLHLRRTSEQ